MYKQLEQLKKEQQSGEGGVGSSPCNLTCGSNGRRNGGGDDERNRSQSPVALKTSPSSSPTNLSRGKSPLVLTSHGKNSIATISNNNHCKNVSARASPMIAAAVGRIARINHHHFVEDMISGEDDPEEQSGQGHRRRVSVSPLESARMARASAERDLSTGSRSPGGGLVGGCWEVLALNINPDLGERIMLSGERALIEESFPETGHAVMDARSTVAWHHDARHVIRFPLNGYCKLNSVQAITRLLNTGYHVAASHGGGMDNQQFSEYLFIRKAIPL